MKSLSLLHLFPLPRAKREQGGNNSSSNQGSLPEKMQPILLLLAFLLLPRADAEQEIEAPSSRPLPTPGYPRLPNAQEFWSHQAGAHPADSMGAHKQTDFSFRGDHRGTRGQAPLPPLHGLSYDLGSEVSEEVRWLPDTRGLRADSCSLLGKLERKAKRTRAVQPLRLPSNKAQVKPGQACSVAGWGQTAPMGKYSHTLQEVKMTVQEDRKCESELRHYYNSTIELCVGDPEIKKASFKGDSGGPLVCNKVAQGIVSYGRNNGMPPRVCTKVSSFVHWIKKTMKRH
nr:granzyme B isoform X1 [Gorilla gorilla gorilla]